MVYFPAAAQTTLRQYLRAFHELIQDDDDEDDVDRGEAHLEQLYAFQLCPLEFNQEITLSKSKGGDEYILRAVACDHRKVCVGYSIFQSRIM